MSATLAKPLVQKHRSMETPVNTDIRASRQELIEFTEMLRDSLESGLTIQDGILDHANKCGKPHLALAFRNIGSNLLKGVDITDAFREYPGIFPREYRALIGAAKTSGRWTKKRHSNDNDGITEGILDLLIRYLSQADSARRMLIKGLIYPAIVVGLILVAIVILGIFVLPTFKEFFLVLEAEPSFFSSILFGTADFIQEHYLLIPLVLIGLVACTIVFWRSHGSDLWQHYQLRIRGVKNLFGNLILAETYWLISVLHSAGLSIQECLSITAEACRNKEIAAAILRSVEYIHRGDTCANALKKAHFIFEGDAYRNISRAEKTGTIDRTFADQAKRLFEKVETQLKSILLMIEPAVMVVTGIGVAIIVISFYGTISQMIGKLASH